MKDRIKTIIYSIAASGAVGITLYNKIYHKLDELEQKHNQEIEKLKALKSSEQNVAHYNNGYYFNHIDTKSANISQIKTSLTWNKKNYQQALNFLEKQQLIKSNRLKVEQDNELNNIYNLVKSLQDDFKKQGDKNYNNDTRLTLLENAITNGLNSVNSRINTLEDEIRSENNNYSNLYKEFNWLKQHQDSIDVRILTQHNNLKVVEQKVNQKTQNLHDKPVIHLNDPSDQKNKWTLFGNRKRRSNYDQNNLGIGTSNSSQPNNKPDYYESSKYYNEYDNTGYNKPDVKSILENEFNINIYTDSFEKLLIVILFIISIIISILVYLIFRSRNLFKLYVINLSKILFKYKNYIIFIIKFISFTFVMYILVEVIYI